MIISRCELTLLLSTLAELHDKFFGLVRNDGAVVLEDQSLQLLTPAALAFQAPGLRTIQVGR